MIERHDKVFVPVSVDERTPKESGRYIAYVEEVNDLGVSRFYWNCYFDAESKSWTDKFIPYKAIHWLEEKENVYVLTEQELQQIIVDAVFEHKNTTIDKFMEKLTHKQKTNE